MAIYFAIRGTPPPEEGVPPQPADRSTADGSTSDGSTAGPRQAKAPALTQYDDEQRKENLLYQLAGSRWIVSGAYMKSGDHIETQETYFDQEAVRGGGGLLSLSGRGVAQGAEEFVLRDIVVTLPHVTERTGRPIRLTAVQVRFSTGFVLFPTGFGLFSTDFGLFASQVYPWAVSLRNDDC